MLEDNGKLCDPLNARCPHKTLFLLITPKIFKDNPTTRLYGHNMNPYQTDPQSLGHDLPYRMGDHLESVQKRLGWVTWDDFQKVNGETMA